MRYLVRENKKLWVAVNDNFPENAQQELRRRANAVQTWFFDLDETHAFPGKKIVQRALGTSHLSPRYLAWCTKTVWNLVYKGKTAESERWQAYINSFLRKEKSLERVAQSFTAESARESLYTGIEEFCSLFPTADKFYVTRNIAEVTRAYVETLCLDGYFAEVNDKGKVVEEYLYDHPHIRRFGVDGDSAEDAEMIKILKFYDREVISFYSMDKSNRKIDTNFDVFVSKDRTALVDLLRN